MVYRWGPRRRRLRTQEKSGSSATPWACCCVPVSHRRTSGHSTYVLASGHIALATDVAALSRPNRCVLLEANKPCGSSVVEGDSARGVLSSNVVVRLSSRLVVVVVASAGGAVGSSTTAGLARCNDREAAEERWRCFPCLFLGGEAWWQGSLGAFDRAVVMRTPPGRLIESRIMS